MSGCSSPTELGATGRLRGVVSDCDGRPLEGVLYDFLPEGGLYDFLPLEGIDGRTEAGALGAVARFTGEGGRYSSERLPFGRYEIVIGPYELVVVATDPIEVSPVGKPEADPDHIAVVDREYRADADDSWIEHDVQVASPDYGPCP